jgi:ATP-dependent Clp protease protease subunit
MKLCLLQAKELEVNTQYYIELLAKGIGKTQEEIAKDIQRSRYFFPQEAIDYGIADKILPKQGLVMEKRVSINHF